MNETLMRSINTSLAAVLPVLSLLVVGAGILGAVALREFALALFIGLMSGSYSSIFIASPLLAILERFGPKGRDRRRRESGGIEKRSDVALAAAAAAGKSVTVSSLRDTGDTLSGSALNGVSDAPDRLTAGAGAGAPTGLTHAPRPRKKKRR
jgi:preprotein translocase subunit SecF